MSHIDELHARLEAVIARGRDTEQRYAAILARHAEQEGADAAETEAVQRFVLGLLEVVQMVAKMEARETRENPNYTRDVVLHSDEINVLWARDRARALLATLAPDTTDAGTTAPCATCGKPSVISDSGDAYCAQCYHDATGEWPGTTGATAGEEGE